MRPMKRYGIWCVRARRPRRTNCKARHRLGKFLLRHGHRRPDGVTAWTKKHREWIKSHVRFTEAALEATLADYLGGAQSQAVTDWPSEHELQTQLHHAPLTAFRVDDSEVGQVVHRGSRIIPVRVIDQVVRLRANLRVETLAISEVLEQ